MRNLRIHLSCDDDIAIRYSAHGKWIKFRFDRMLYGNVYLGSKAYRQCDVNGVWFDDRRYFGVQPGRCIVFNPMSTFEHKLDFSSLDGWVSDGSDNPWTSGFANLGKIDLQPGGIIAIEILNTAYDLLQSPPRSESIIISPVKHI